MTATYQLTERAAWEHAYSGLRQAGQLSESFCPQEVHHEKNNPADCGAAFGFFTFALVSCDRHDFFRGLALLHGY
jgi:hypothetical protein